MNDLYIEVKNLAFGSERAENETELFYDRFVSTPSYLNAKDKEKQKLYYVGHRGSGKTALFRKLMKEFAQTDAIILEIAPDNYSYESLKKLEHSFYDIKSTYIYAWEYTIFVLIFNKVVNHFEIKRSIKSNRENVSSIKQFLIENELLKLEDNLSIFIKSLVDFNENHKKLEFKHNSLDNKMNVFEFLKMINRTALFHPLQALSFISQSFPVYIFIDELDTGWDNSKEARNFINGLISSVAKIEKIKNLNLKFYVSLRQDMYDNLSGTFADTEKIRSNIEKLSWNENYLKNILVKRIITKLQNSEAHESVNREAYMTIVNKKISYENILYSVFTQDALETIFETSLKRPREIIQFCNLCVDKIRLFYSDLTSKLIDNEIVQIVQDEFIEQRINFFCEEYKYELPNLYTLISFFENGKATFSIESFIVKLEESIINFMDKHPADKWIVEYCDLPKKLIEKLFEIGFVRYENKANGRFVAFYESDNSKKFTLDSIQNIKINTIFQINFNCSDENDQAKIKFNIVKPTNLPMDKKSMVRIFLSYSHKDEDVKEQLDTHLSALRRSDKISYWNDRKITPGMNWDEIIKRELDQADIILLLVSASFNDSEYIWHNELKKAIDKYRNGDAIVIPIFCKPCDFEDMPFAGIQGLPKNAKPITSYGSDIEQALTDVAKGIRKVVNDLSSKNP